MLQAGGVAEWSIATVLKTVKAKHLRGFESLPLRQIICEQSKTIYYGSGHHRDLCRALAQRIPLALLELRDGDEGRAEEMHVANPGRIEGLDGCRDGDDCAFGCFYRRR
jgi:hypothetical protein